MMEKTYTGRLQWHVTTNSIRLIIQYLHFNHKMPGNCSSKKIKNLIYNDSNCSSYQLFLDLRQITDLTSLKDSVSFFWTFISKHVYLRTYLYWKFKTLKQSTRNMLGKKSRLLCLITLNCTWLLFTCNPNKPKKLQEITVTTLLTTVSISDPTPGKRTAEVNTWQRCSVNYTYLGTMWRKNV